MRIIVQIKEGLVEVHNIPKGMEVVVRDYDTQGADSKDLKKDEDGIDCFESIWQSE